MNLSSKNHQQDKTMLYLHVPYAYIYCTHLLHVRRIIFNNTSYIRRARTGLIQVYKTLTTFGHPDQSWQPKVGPIMAAKSGPPGPLFARTNFRVTGPEAFRILVDHHRPEAVTTKTYQLLKNTLQRHYQAGICIEA